MWRDYSVIRTKEELEKEYGKVWESWEAKELFEFKYFIYNTVAVVRRSDNKEGHLDEQKETRYYFSFVIGRHLIRD
jgi:hypothetical protein